VLAACTGGSGSGSGGNSWETIFVNIIFINIFSLHPQHGGTGFLALQRARLQGKN